MPIAARLTPDEELEQFVGGYYDDPLGYVRIAFPWGEAGTFLAEYPEPRAWQCEFLEWLGGEIKARAFDGVHPVAAIEAAVSSGHGIGKGALTGMLVNFLMSTRKNARGTITANTSTQLDDKTWASTLQWHKLSVTAHWFEANTQILYRVGHRESWRCTPQTCDPDNSESFAGQHSAQSTSFYINDEDCCREDTEVLTRRGWVRFPTLTAADECVTMDQMTGIAEYQPVVALHWAKRSGQMLECTGRNASWSVTPNHKMWVQTRRPRTASYGPWRLKTAKDVTRHDRMSRLVQWGAPDVSTFTIPAFTSARKHFPARTVPMDAWCAFLGWYFSEGNVVTRINARGGREHVGVGISNRDIGAAEHAARGLGIQTRVYGTAGAVKQFRTHDRALCEYLGPFGLTCLTRRLPGFLRDVSARQMNIFLDAYVAGDGYRKTPKLEILYTSSPFLADGLHELCVKAGWGSTVTVRRLKGRVSDLGSHTATSTTDGYVVTRSAERSMLTFQKAGRIREVDYDGMVYCATLPKHHLLYTRRRGSCVWVGNSNVPEKIHEVQEGGLALGEAMRFLFGNPTRRTGFFYDAVFGEHRHRFKSWIIDTRDVEGHSESFVARIQQTYGDESDAFRVRVMGRPPNASDAQFIGHQRILDATKRHVSVLPDEPLVAGCDLAWGGDDYNVIRFRRGADARTVPPIRIPGRETRDPSVLVNRLADVLTGTYGGYKVAMLFLDSAGIAGPVGARLRQLGHTNLVEVNFGADSPSPKRRFFRDHLWAELNDWLITGAIADDPRLIADLESVDVRYDPKQRLWLESKEDVKKRLKRSPDDGDALALTFGQKVGPKLRTEAEPARPPRPRSAWG